MTIKIIKSGLATSIQDLGRPGYFHLGIPIGGAMDRLAHRCANLLVGNPEDSACLEAVFMGPEVGFNDDCFIAVTGGEMPVLIDGIEVPSWTCHHVKKGQTLSFGYIKKGARIYIAISGGIDTKLALGSRSTYLIGALGGFEGRNVLPGDTIPIGRPGNARLGASLSQGMRRLPSSPASLRVLPGLYWHRITQSAQEQFFQDEWQVAPEADRMGIRFKGGKEMEFVEREPPFGAGSDPSNIVDGCYPYGSIQIPGGTEPIVLHRDAVSGGGYFTIGTVISADMDLIGQLQPNTSVVFVKVDMDEALAARKKRTELLKEIRVSLGT